jgi:hypothetical protein
VIEGMGRKYIESRSRDMDGDGIEMVEREDIDILY